MENADRPEEKRSVVAPTLLLLLPVLYLASVGPLYGLNERGILSDSTWETICRTVYLPLVYLEEETRFFESPPGAAYIWYLELFAD